MNGFQRYLERSLDVLSHLDMKNEGKGKRDLMSPNFRVYVIDLLILEEAKGLRDKS